MRLPSLVEIEINSQCNLSCSYCPNSIDERIEKGDMSRSLFEKIIQDLVKYNYQGQIAFEFYNEPLLAKEIDYNIGYLKKNLPRTTLILYSNALKLNTEEIFLKYINLGVDKFVITKHEQVEKLEFEDVYKKLSVDLKKRVDFKNHKQIKKFNRAGALKNLGGDLSCRSLPCHIPSTVLTISVKGNILSCFEDFYQKYTFGNAEQKNILELWNDNQYTKFQDDLKKGKRDLYSTCKNCNRKDSVEIKNKHLIDHEELEAIKRVFDSNSLFRYSGSKGECDICEEEFCEYFGSNYSHILNSGTNALVVALMALGIGPKDEVIIPAYTFFATAGAVLQVGAIPVIVDIADDLLMDINSIEMKINENTKAIIPVHMDGLQCDIKKICEIARKKNIYVIEDVAQAFGAEVENKKLGTWGDIGCFSFNRDKIITAGEGGLVITSDEKINRRILSSLDQAISFNPAYQDLMPEEGAFLGISTRISEITGAMLRVQLKKADKIIIENKKHKEIYIKELQKSKSYENNFSIISARDVKECYSSLHLKFLDPTIAGLMSKKLLEEGIKILPITMRRAHCIWKWSHFLKPGMVYNLNRDPYTELSYQLKKQDYINSLMLLPSVLRLEMDITKSEFESTEDAQRMRIKMEAIFEKL